MIHRTWIYFVVASFLLALSLCASRLSAAPILGHHPGNIFVQGDHVIVAVPDSGPWQRLDIDGHAAVAVTKDQQADLGKLPVGYYELRHQDGSGRITLAVVAPLKAPPPETSPISIDVAMSWMWNTVPEKQAVVHLCRLLGVNWVRDRLSWPDMEPQRGKFSPPNKYDESDRMQTAAGLRVLQVNHIAPPWNAPGGDSRGFPLDLRDVYSFYREMAKRFADTVPAIEPWNEADIVEFGGQIGSEMATLQKAAYLGIKAGNPKMIACENVFAIDRQDTLTDFGQNDATAYFDRYDLHHYVPLARYPSYYAKHRAVNGGKPMWVTECNITVPWTGDPKFKEPSDDMLRVQALRLVKIFASSLNQGSRNTFYFMLPNYSERQVQYGLLHDDLTPRPAFLSMAAVGRLLADARPCGKLDEHDCNVYLFDAKPDGQKKLVLVAWSHAPMSLSTPKRDATFDDYGRSISNDGPLALSNTPVIALFDPDQADHFSVEPPPTTEPVNTNPPSMIVLQTPLGHDTRDTNHSAHAIAPTGPQKLPLVAYDFGTMPAHGTLTVNAPAGWDVRIPPSIDVKPGQRVEGKFITVDPHGAANGSIGTIRIAGNFGDAGKVVLSFRLIVETKK